MPDEDREFAENLMLLCGGEHNEIDRLEIAQSLEDAVTALILWDLLPEGARDKMLTPWAHLSE
jgi:hypothetical protein